MISDIRVDIMLSDYLMLISRRYQSRSSMPKRNQIYKGGGTNEKLGKYRINKDRKRGGVRGYWDSSID